MTRDRDDGNLPAGGKHKPIGSCGGVLCGTCHRVLVRVIYVRAGYVCTVLTIATPSGRDDYCLGSTML